LSMKKLLVLQHVRHEGLGNLDPLFQNAGIQIDSVNFSCEPDARPSLDGYDGLVVLGGPMSAYDTDRHPHLVMETNLIERAAGNNLPVLGICLGSQLIASALGARVYPNGIKEIGWYDLSPTENAKDDPLFRHVVETEKVFQWHGDTFDLPQGGIHLASSSLCSNQAFRYGKTIYALQFHLEIDVTMIESWLTVFENRQEIADLKGAINPNVIRAETPRCIGRLQELSEQVFGEFVKLLAAGDKR
jgi:GMP synthase (glutamine-hydrolysing)